MSHKFNDIPNTGHLDIWIQRIALGIKCDIQFKEPLCNLAIKKPIDIWNFSWLKINTINTLKRYSIINQDIIENLPEAITRKEVELFNSDYSSY